MNSQSASSDLDWNLVRAFQAVAEAGSLSSAARRTGQSQPTLSRQIAQLEAVLGSALFERTSRGLLLTKAGHALLGPAKGMSAAAQALSLAAAGQAQALAGTVRVTASEIASAYLLPPVLARLRRRHPEIQIELVASDELENLLAHEADIALRMVRPAQTALVARKLGEWPLGAYAHREYLAQRGRPRGLGDLADHDWVGYDRSDQILRGFRSFGVEATREMFAFRCDHQVVAWQAVLAGLGIGFGLQAVAALSPQLERVLEDVPIPPLPAWLVSHRELRGSPRIRAVFDALAADLRALTVE